MGHADMSDKLFEVTSDKLWPIIRDQTWLCLWIRLFRSQNHQLNVLFLSWRFPSA